MTLEAWRKRVEEVGALYDGTPYFVVFPKPHWWRPRARRRWRARMAIVNKAWSDFRAQT